jgi:hypothetical protein
MIREIFGEDTYLVAVEIFKKTARYLKNEHIYNRVVNLDIVSWCKDNTSYYDLAILGDVLEHLYNFDEVHYILNRVLSHFDNIIIISPLGEEKQGAKYGNIYETHRLIFDDHFFDRYHIVEKNIKQVELPGNEKTKLYKINLWIKK